MDGLKEICFPGLLSKLCRLHIVSISFMIEYAQNDELRSGRSCKGANNLEANGALKKFVCCNLEAYGFLKEFNCFIGLYIILHQYVGLYSI